MHAALPPGGTLTVIDLLLEDGRAQPVFSTLFSLDMMLFNPSAGVFEVRRTMELLAAAGFREIEHRGLPDLPYGAVSAHR